MVLVVLMVLVRSVYEVTLNDAMRLEALAEQLDNDKPLSKVSPHAPPRAPLIGGGKHSDCGQSRLMPRHRPFPNFPALC